MKGQPSQLTRTMFNKPRNDHYYRERLYKIVFFYWSEDVFESIARSNKCTECAAQCPASVQQRNGLREELRKMLETAVSQV